MIQGRLDNWAQEVALYIADKLMHPWVDTPPPPTPPQFFNGTRAAHFRENGFHPKLISDISKMVTKTVSWSAPRLQWTQGSIPNIDQHPVNSSRHFASSYISIL